MEDSKYYTPLSEDLCVGYEAECCFSSYAGYMIWDINEPEKSILHEPEDKEAAKHWVKFWLVEEETMETGNNQRNHKTALEILKDKRLRTPYLTKEDIEAEEWECGELSNHKMINYPMYKIVKNAENLINSTYVLETRPDQHITIYVKHSFNNDVVYLYNGKCPSVNELRKIMKWTGIK